MMMRLCDWCVEQDTSNDRQCATGAQQTGGLVPSRIHPAYYRDHLSTVRTCCALYSSSVDCTNVR